MATPNKKQKLEVEDIDDIKDDIRDIRNDIERIKGDTHSISRIMNLANSGQIEKDVTLLVGSSEIRAAILELAKDEISRQDLAYELGIDPRNLTKFVDPFLDKGYVASIKRGKSLSYRRTETIDLLGIQNIPQINSLIQAWRARRQSKAPGQETSPQDRNANNETGNSGGSSNAVDGLPLTDASQAD